MNDIQTELNYLPDGQRANCDFLNLWIIVTAVSWSAGLLLGFFVAGVIGEILNLDPAAGLEDTLGNVVLGLILGAVVGTGQRAVIRRDVALSLRWALTPGIILSAGFALELIADSAYSPQILNSAVLQSIMFGLAGGLSGLLQSRSWPKDWSWPVGSALGWFSANLLMQSVTRTPIPGSAMLFLFMAGLLLSGATLGAITGLAIWFAGRGSLARR